MYRGRKTAPRKQHLFQLEKVESVNSSGGSCPHSTAVSMAAAIDYRPAR
jgi:hypothetical protein